MGDGEEPKIRERRNREMGSSSRLIIFFLICFIVESASSEIQAGIRNFNDGGDKISNNDFNSNVEKNFGGQVIEVKSEPKDVAWVVQLSDLHFSVHHPERAIDFESIVGPTLAMINPSLVIVTGDLTGNSSSLLQFRANHLLDALLDCIFIVDIIFCPKLRLMFTQEYCCCRCES